MRRIVTAVAAVLVLSSTSGAAIAQQGAPETAPAAGEANGARPAPAAGDDKAAPIDLGALLGSGGRKSGAALRSAIDQAAAHPLGSKENPVRVNMPGGQRAYLSRLRCANDRTPSFHRVGSFGPGVFGSIIDGYSVVCPGDGEPKESLIFMDMYHPDHDETGPPPGFTIVRR